MKALAIYLVAVVLLVTSASGQYIWINLSYKIVLNPTDGTRPPGVTDANIQQAVAQMNNFLSAYGRNYRMRLAHSPIEISGSSDGGPGYWYAFDFVNFPSPPLTDWKDVMESAAKADGRYNWRNDAINLYLTAGICGGKCSFPQENDEIVIMGGCSADDGLTQLHEIGHFFALYHTQGASCGCCGSGSGQCNVPGDDYIYDTLPDLPCWDRDQISINAFRAPYLSLDASQRKPVDDTIQNIMSYHNPDNACNHASEPSFQLTERQLDVWADFANTARRAVVSGGTTFFDWRNNCVGPAGNSIPSESVGICYSGPFPTLAPLATADPGGGDLVAVIRPGNYPGPLTISRPMTLVATRSGLVTIGR